MLLLDVVFIKKANRELELLPGQRYILKGPFRLLPYSPKQPPRASNLPEKLIICHISSVLSRTPMRSSRWQSKNKEPCQAF